MRELAGFALILLLLPGIQRSLAWQGHAAREAACRSTCIAPAAGLSSALFELLIPYFHDHLPMVAVFLLLLRFLFAFRWVGGVGAMYYRSFAVGGPFRTCRGGPLRPRAAINTHSTTLPQMSPFCLPFNPDRPYVKVGERPMGVRAWYTVLLLPLRK